MSDGNPTTNVEKDNFTCYLPYFNLTLLKENKNTMLWCEIVP